MHCDFFRRDKDFVSYVYGSLRLSFRVAFVCGPRSRCRILFSSLIFIVFMFFVSCSVCVVACHHLVFVL